MFSSKHEDDWNNLDINKPTVCLPLSSIKKVVCFHKSVLNEIQILDISYKIPLTVGNQCTVLDATDRCYLLIDDENDSKWYSKDYFKFLKEE